METNIEGGVTANGIELLFDKALERPKTGQGFVRHRDQKFDGVVEGRR